MSALLPAGGVLLRWMAPPAEGDANGAWLATLLDAAERERAGRFRFAPDRAAYVAAHALLRGLLGAKLGRPAPALRFAAAPGGRPELAGEPEAAGLRFSLAHAHGLVVAALADAEAVGVDVEPLERSPAGDVVPGAALAPFERDQLRALAGAARTEASLTLWTLKEAYLKATGLGLAGPPEAVGFTLAPLAVRFAAPLRDDPARWTFRHWYIGTTHAVALAVRGGAPASVDARALSVDELRRIAAAS